MRGQDMQAQQIAIHTGQPDAPYETVGDLKVKKGAQPTPFNKRPTEDELAVKLREQAAKLGLTPSSTCTTRRGSSPPRGGA
jgi:hypothetical protein